MTLRINVLARLRLDLDLEEDLILALGAGGVEKYVNAQLAYVAGARAGKPILEISPGNHDMRLISFQFYQDDVLAAEDEEGRRAFNGVGMYLDPEAR